MNAKKIIILFCCALLISVSLQAIPSTTYTNSLEDCEAFASLFFNTCDSTPMQSDLDFTALASETESCYFAGQCPDGSSNAYCEW
jgi:hypothetical protein